MLEPAIDHGAVLIICNVGQRVTNQRQTLDCLEFGKRATRVYLGPPRQNLTDADGRDASAAELHKLQQQLNAAKSSQSKLQADIATLRDAESNRSGVVEQELLEICAGHVTTVL